MRKKNLAIILFLVIIVSLVYNLNRGRKLTAEGFQCGSQKISKSTVRNYYIFRFDTVKIKGKEEVRKPRYAILWRSKNVDASYSSSWHLVKKIHDGEIIIPQKEKVIYSLQPDFTLSILPLKEVELNSLFEMFLVKGKKKPFYENRIWQTQIAPNLVIVEVPEEK